MDTKLTQNICSKCHEQQYSAVDRAYLVLHGKCWACDHKLWSSGKIDTTTFQERERRALEYTQRAYITL